MKALRLTAAILALVVGVGVVLVSIGGYYYYTASDASIMIAIAIIVMGSLLFRDRRNKGIAIALLVLSSVLALLSFASLASITSIYYDYYYSSKAYMSAFHGVFLLLSTGLIFVTSFYLGTLKKYWAKETCPTVSANTNFDTIANKIPSNSSAEPARTFEWNITVLKQMKQAGTLTEKEFKEIAAREINKFISQDS